MPEETAKARKSAKERVAFIGGLISTLRGIDGDGLRSDWRGLVEAQQASPASANETIVGLQPTTAC